MQNMALPKFNHPRLYFLVVKFTIHADGLKETCHMKDKYLVQIWSGQACVQFHIKDWSNPK